VLLEPLTVDLGVDEHAREVVRRPLSAMSFWQRSKSCGTQRSITACGPSGLRSGSPAPRIAFMRSAHSRSSSGGTPMKLPMTRDTTGWATSVTRSHVSRPARRSKTSTVMARMRSSCSAIRFGVKPRWKSAFRRSCFGGSMPMNIARWSSTGMTESTTSVMPPFSDENVSQSRLTLWTSSAVVIDQ